MGDVCSKQLSNQLMKYSYKNETKTLIKLSIPVIFAQIAQTGITFVDTILAGHYTDNNGDSDVALSGVALGVSIWLPTILFGQGLLSVLTPIIANLNGAGKRQQIADHTRQGLVIATLLSIILMTLLYHSDKIIALRNGADNEINPEMMHVAVYFLRSIMWGVPGFLYFLVYRFQCEGLSNTNPTMYVMFIALLANIPINYVLIYGKLGLPAFGGIGCGITGAIVFWLMFILIKCYTAMTPTQKDIRQTPFTQLFEFKILKRIIVLGIPLALAYFFEVSLFAIIALMIAPLGKDIVASHQIVFALSSMTFTLPLALGVATSIRVGYLLGKQQPLLAKRTAYVSLTIALLLSLTVAILLVVFKRFFIICFTNDLNIIELSLPLIILLAIYQVFDYLQVTASNVLRGYKDTKSIFYITFISYWGIGLPLGYILGLTNWITEPMGAAGFWMSIIFGLLFAAVLLIGRMIMIQRQPSDKILMQANQ